jgi:hypothetical protein
MPLPQVSAQPQPGEYLGEQSNSEFAFFWDEPQLPSSSGVLVAEDETQRGSSATGDSWAKKRTGAPPLIAEKPWPLAALAAAAAASVVLSWLCAAPLPVSACAVSKPVWPLVLLFSCDCLIVHSSVAGYLVHSMGLP